MDEQITQNTLFQILLNAEKPLRIPEIMERLPSEYHLENDTFKNFYNRTRKQIEKIYETNIIQKGSVRYRGLLYKTVYSIDKDLIPLIILSIQSNGRLKKILKENPLNELF